MIYLLFFWGGGVSKHTPPLFVLLYSFPYLRLCCVVCIKHNDSQATQKRGGAISPPPSRWTYNSLVENERRRVGGEKQARIGIHRVHGRRLLSESTNL